MNLYRIAYVVKKAPDANPQEKVCFVAAETDSEAVWFVNSEPGNQVMSASKHVPDIKIVNPKKGK